MATTFWGLRRPKHQPTPWRACGQGVQTRRPRCAQAGEIVVEMAGRKGSLMLASCDDVIHWVCARKTSRRFCRPENPQALSTVAGLASCGRRLCGRARAGTAGLLGFDGVFDRGGRAPARDGGHRPARGRPPEHGRGGPGGPGRRRLVDGQRDRPGAGPARLRVPQARLTTWASRACRLARPAGEAWGLAGHDVDVDPGGDLGMQPDADLVRADGLDRVTDLDPAAVEYGTARLADRRGDVGGPDRAEQPAVAARAPPHPHVQLLELAGDDLGVLQAADLAGRPGPLDEADLLLRAAGPQHREAARDQVVAAVAAGHVHHVTGCTEAAHLLGEDELHRGTTHLPDLS